MPKKSRALKNHRHELFCQYFVFGNPEHDRDDPFSPPDTRHHATESYLAAGYNAARDTARMAGSRLIARDDIRARLAELRKEYEKIKDAFLDTWRSMLPEAQDVLRRAMDPRETVSQADINAAKAVIEQAEGPTRFRFGIDSKAGDSVSGLHVTIWGGKKE